MPPNKIKHPQKEPQLEKSSSAPSKGHPPKKAYPFLLGAQSPPDCNHNSQGSAFLKTKPASAAAPIPLQVGPVLLSKPKVLALLSYLAKKPRRWWSQGTSRLLSLDAITPKDHSPQTTRILILRVERASFVQRSPLESNSGSRALCPAQDNLRLTRSTLTCQAFAGDLAAKRKQANERHPIQKSSLASGVTLLNVHAPKGLFFSGQSSENAEGRMG